MAKHESVGTLPSDYNAKLGPVLFNVNGSLEGEYVDNVALTNSGKTDDFIITPQVGIEARWPVTETNSLRLSTSIGYSKYLIHPQYDTTTILIAPDSVLSFDVYVGDFKINFHDQFSFQQDPASVGALSNVVNFNRFENIAGIGVIWDLNKLVFSFNYDHINFISESLQPVSGVDYSNPSNLSYSADQISLAGTYNFTSTFSGGLEFTGSMRSYDHNDVKNTQASVGPFVRIEMTPDTKLSLSGGFQTADTTSGNLSAASASFPNNVSPVFGVGTTNSYYVNGTLDHRLNRYYTDRFSVGHELQVDVFNQQSEVTYVTYTSSWKVNTDLNLSLTLNYENVESVGSNTAIATGSYDMFSAGLQANFPVTKSISGAVLYQFNDKFDAPNSQGYLQNRIGLILNYHF